MYCQWMINALNITVYSSHISPAKRPRQPLTATNRCHHCPACSQVTEASDVRDTACMHVFTDATVLVQCLQWQTHLMSFADSELVGNHTAAEIEGRRLHHPISILNACTLMGLHLSLCCTCKRPRSMRKAPALFLGPPEKCDVTCQMSKMKWGGRCRWRKERWGYWR